jgi:cysteinyl-tRNA synthetase
MSYTEEKSKQSASEIAQVNKAIDEMYDNMNDDFNTAEVIGRMFELMKRINAYKNTQAEVSELDNETFERMKKEYVLFFDTLLGLNVKESIAKKDISEGLMDLILQLRKKVRDQKDFATSDQIRDVLNELGIQVKDGKEGTSWTRN